LIYNKRNPGYPVQCVAIEFNLPQQRCEMCRTNIAFDGPFDVSDGMAVYHCVENCFAPGDFPLGAIKTKLKMVTGTGANADGNVVVSIDPIGDGNVE
jgi:hypothetical protein